MKYEFHPEAELEVIEYAARYESDVPGLGERFGDEIERVVELLLDNPKSGALLEGEIRHFVLRRFPRSVVYAVVHDLLYVLAVAHGRREPGYWTARIDR
jgi:toxin ParE1/3/4